MRPNVAFDIDGVVANFADPFVKYAEERYGIKFLPSQKYHWDTEPEITPMLFEKLIAWFIRDHSNKIKTKSDGENLVDYVWRNTKKPITFVTARHEMTVSATHHWLKHTFFGIDFVLITVDGHSDKIRYLNDFDTFVEDRRRTVLELASLGKKVIMPVRHYNWPLRKQAYQEFGVDLMDNILPVESLNKLTDGTFNHLLFK